MISKFDIINASAGSGKTFALTQRILVKILKSKDENYFKRILALTFTNRAAEEMKTRILNALKDFSDPKIIGNPSVMFIQVKKELKFTSDKINRLSKERLNLLLHNYSFFQIETLDSFNHHIIRSFSKELNLDPDFRVVIDTEDILDQSVSRVFEDIENNKEISSLLKDFSIRKISEGKSWDVEFDL
ncbi:UvrD-helicase domain-containing protein, partial [Hellea sp.]|nr:UvrD-helicase domain-containing protein [Hellea sp.]